MKWLPFCLILIAAPTLVFGSDGISFRTDPPAPPDQLPVRDGHFTRDDCNLINFEGVGDYNPVGTFAGDVTVSFGSSWLGLVDADDGGNGNFANEPSSNTIAFFLDQNDISIGLSPSVQYVSFYYTASAVSLPVTVTAYDAAGNFVDQAEGNEVGTDYDGADCTGDPTGNFCHWGLIELIAATNNIASVVIQGTVENQFGIDDVLFCVTPPPSATEETTWGKVKGLYR